jgi:hypothetical protein
VPDAGSFTATDYVGTGVDEARSRAEAAGWTVRVIAANGVYTLDFRPDRVNLVVEDGTVTDATLG